MVVSNMGNIVDTDEVMCVKDPSLLPRSLRRVSLLYAVDLSGFTQLHTVEAPVGTTLPPSVTKYTIAHRREERDLDHAHLNSLPLLRSMGGVLAGEVALLPRHLTSLMIVSGGDVNLCASHLPSTLTELTVWGPHKGHLDLSHLPLRSFTAQAYLCDAPTISLPSSLTSLSVKGWTPMEIPSNVVRLRIDHTPAHLPPSLTCLEMYPDVKCRVDPSKMRRLACHYSCLQDEEGKWVPLPSRLLRLCVYGSYADRGGRPLSYPLEMLPRSLTHLSMELTLEDDDVALLPRPLTYLQVNEKRPLRKSKNLPVALTEINFNEGGMLMMDRSK